MAGKLNLYNLGKLGVNVDKSPVHLDDLELTKSQNAIHDPIGALDGALKNRPGLVKHNSVAGAGSILGGVGVPLLRTSTRTYYMGESSQVGGLGASVGWWRSTDAFATTATEITSNPGIPRANQIGDFAGGNKSTLGGSPGASVFLNNKFYYAGNYTVTSGPPVIRVWDGTDDYEFCRIPNNPESANTYATGVLSMMAANGTMYLSTIDAGTNNTNYRGRVFELDPTYGSLTLLGTTFPLGYLPYALTWHAGRVWAGTHTATDTDTGRIYYFRPGVDTAWTLDHTTAASNGNVCSLYSFQGKLFAGLMAAAATFATVKQRDSAGAWTIVRTASTGTARAANGFLQMWTLSGVLYVSYWNNDTTQIAEVHSYDGTSWALAATLTGAVAAPMRVFVDNATIFLAGGGLGTSSELFTSTNGTTYTDRSANLPSGNTTQGAFGVIRS